MEGAGEEGAGVSSATVSLASSAAIAGIWKGLSTFLFLLNPEFTVLLSFTGCIVMFQLIS